MIILLTGLPGTGKTETARFLNKKIPDSLILRNDEIRKELFGVEGGKGFSEDQTALINKTVIDRTSVAIKEGRTVILDRVSPFDEERKMLKELAHDLDTAFVLISVSAPESIVKQRIEERLLKDPLGVPFSVYLIWAQKYEPAEFADYNIVNDGEINILEGKVNDIIEKIM